MAVDHRVLQEKHSGRRSEWPKNTQITALPWSLSDIIERTLTFFAREVRTFFELECFGNRNVQVDTLVLTVNLADHEELSEKETFFCQQCHNMTRRDFHGILAGFAFYSRVLVPLLPENRSV